MFGPEVEMPAKMPVSPVGMPGFDTQLWLLTAASCHCKPWRALLMAVVIGLLLSVLADNTDTLGSCIWLLLFWHLGEVNQQVGVCVGFFVCLFFRLLSLYLCLSSNFKF